MRTRAARLAAATTTTAAVLLGLGAPAHADPPSGWGPGQYGVEYDFAGFDWIHHGHYHGIAGNWHTGWVNVEEDDDGITGDLVDWRCPRHVVPPSPYDDPTGTRCVEVGDRYLEDNLNWDTAVFHQASNRLTLNRDVPAYDSTTGADLGTVRIDVSMRAKNPPVVVDDESGPILDYSEDYVGVPARGRVDGHRVSGPCTRPISSGRIGFWLDGWERTS